MAEFSDLQAKFNSMLSFAVEHGTPTESLSCSICWYLPGLYKRIYILWEWDCACRDRSVAWHLEQWRHHLHPAYDITSGSFGPVMLKLDFVTLV